MLNRRKESTVKENLKARPRRKRIRRKTKAGKG
jgi:hypothetical protein